MMKTIGMKSVQQYLYHRVNKAKLNLKTALSDSIFHAYMLIKNSKNLDEKAGPPGMEMEQNR